jgi:exodeoxyribonuclease-5
MDNTFQVQSQIIRDALLHLAGLCDGAHDQDGVGFNGLDAQYGHSLAQQAAKRPLSPRQEFEACKMLRKYWRQLKKVGIVLPKPYLNHYSLKIHDEESATVANLSKGTQYEILRDGFGDMTCDCQAASAGALCGHLKYAADHWPIESQPVPSQPLVEEPNRVEAVETQVEMLPGIFATEGQAKALDELMAFAQDSGSVLHLLSGFAGTGKTVLLQAWLKRLRDAGDKRPVVFTAPTNKATEVLRTMVERWELGVDCVTCAKLLGLKPSINHETGQEEFKKAYSEESTIQIYSLVVVDESSMVSSQLFEYLVEEANILTKLLFVGDWAQLPPVGEPISRVFTETATSSNLTEVKRYSGAIALAADDLRRNLGRRGEPMFSTEHDGTGRNGLFVLTEDSWRANLLKAFQSEASQENPDYCRALAWRNRTVNSLNQFIRSGIRGVDCERFVIGERLLATEHYSRPDPMTGQPKTVFSTSAEMELVNAYEGTQGGWGVWLLEVQLLDATGLQTMIPVLHEREFKRFEQEQSRVKKLALSKDKSAWKTWHENRKQFAYVDYAYAMTVHKSQGSTFTNVFLDVGDILADRSDAVVTLPTGERQKVYERNQLLYVALTRAAERVFIFE